MSDQADQRSRSFSPRFAIPAPALFLDRDGVLIEEKRHLCKPQDVVLFPGAQDLLRQAQQYGWPAVMITNQSGIARGLFQWDDYERVTDRLLDLLGPDAPLSAIYANGHSPDAPTSSWRKPSPAMLVAASQELNLDLNGSLLIGDRLSDLQAGAAAGLDWLGHVLTGHGQRERPGVVARIGPSGHFQWENPSNRLAHVVLLESLLDFPEDLFRAQALSKLNELP